MLRVGLIIIGMILVGASVLAQEPTAVPIATPSLPPTLSTLPPSNETTGTGEWKGSLMLAGKDLEMVNKAIEAFVTDVPLETLIPDFSSERIEEFLDETLPETPGNEAPIVEHKTFFYLNSIVYISPDRWLVWLNGKKLHRLRQMAHYAWSM